MERGTLFGTYVKITGECTAEKLSKAKNVLLDNVCKMIREIADKNDDFFIITDGASMPIFKEEYTAVGCKFFLPTVNDPEEITIPISVYLEE